MKDKEILLNNKLIAEFMRCSINSKGEVSPKGSKYTFPNKDNKRRHKANLRYHLEWNWLMPVVEKCIKYGIYGSNFSGGTGISTQLTQVSLNGVYYYVIKFIKWYNESKN